LVVLTLIDGSRLIGRIFPKADMTAAGVGLDFDLGIWGFDQPDGPLRATVDL